MTNHPSTLDYTTLPTNHEAHHDQPPIVHTLKRVFTSLDDSALLVSLKGPARRGPRGYDVGVLWHCVITRYVLGLESTASLIRTLQNNPYIAKVCGINSPDGIPHEATFSRFFTRLAKYRTAAKLKDVSRALVRKCYAEISGFGDRVAMDSTTLKAWSNGSRIPKADPEAGWSIKNGSQGTKEFTYAWKLHLLVDCETELPISGNVSAGDVHDSKRASNLLREARFTHKNFGSTNTGPRFVLADQGYSGRPLFGLIRRQYKAEPIIQVNKAHKRLALAEPQWSPEWTALYKQRQSVERSFSRLKGQRSLNHIRVRGLRKVTAHCYLALISMQAVAMQKLLSEANQLVCGGKI